MKIDRLLSIIIYLLNHDTVSAAKLAERFEVSRRTILRDMDQIAQAGIPVQAQPGAAGGYSIIKGYRLDRQLANGDDFLSIVTALKGLCTVYDDKRFDAALEKVLTVVPMQREQHVFLDFGAGRENDTVQEYLKTIEKAIADRLRIEIGYVNARCETSRRVVEPLALTYKWHAWYMLAYCTAKQDYRLFKVVRINELSVTRASISDGHADAEELLQCQLSRDTRRYLDITVLCKAEVRMQALEYLSSNVVETFENGDFICKMCLPEEERMWFAMLSSFGGSVTVLGPEEVKERLVRNAREIISLYC